MEKETWRMDALWANTNYMRAKLQKAGFDTGHSTTPIIPLYVRDNQISTQYIMTTLEELGLLKMDFLGLRTLTVIKDTMDLVKKNRGITVEFDKDMGMILFQLPINQKLIFR